MEECMVKAQNKNYKDYSFKNFGLLDNTIIHKELHHQQSMTAIMV